jgi:hypothetical protein
MSKKSRSKKRMKSSGGRPNGGGSSRYTPAEIAMAVLGAAILVMLAGIIITSFFD